MIVVLAEKPSVARDLAAVIGAATRCNGYLEGNGHRVTSAIGHLVGLAQPEEINPAWKAWSRESLPMLPSEFPLRVLENTRAQFRVVKRLLCARETTQVIAATDAGREGELIFRLIYESAGCSKPVERLWLSSMTPDAIRAALANLQPGSRYDGLAAAARARSQADWLVGMNLSRAYTLTSGTLYSVGRVQTPTLAMVVRRDREISRFVSEPYLEVEATFEGATGAYKGTYHAWPLEQLRDERGQLRAFQPQQSRLPADGIMATTLVARARSGQAKVAAIDLTTRRTPAPQLFDLTALQKESNRLYGLSAQETLDAAQALYEQHKTLSYPRTDSRYLSASVARTLPSIVATIAPLYPGLVAAQSGEPPGRRWVDDAKVSDHHALIPTTRRPPQLPAHSAPARIYDLVCRRVLMMWHAEQIEAVTRLITEVRSTEGASDLYVTQGTAVEALGWKVLSPPAPSSKSPTELPTEIPAGLHLGSEQRVTNALARRKATRPPPAHTEASVLAAMEHAGHQIDNETLREAMRGLALGTPATRAATIETLLKRGYLSRHGKSLTSTATGQALIAAVSDTVASPELTGRWEKRLRSIEQGTEPIDTFMRDIAQLVRELVATEASKPIAPRAQPSSARPPGKRRRPTTGMRIRTNNQQTTATTSTTEKRRP